MKRLTSICLVVCLASCNAQQQKNQRIDTAKLFDPSNSNDGIEKIIETKNAIVLQKDFYDIILGDNDFPIVGKEKVAKFLNDSFAIIGRKKFYILINNSKPFKDIVDVIDMVKAAKIPNYQVYNLETQIEPPAKVEVVAPTSIAYKAEPIDPSYLKMKLTKNGYEISLLSDSLKTGEIKKVDNFLLENLEKIDKNKVFIYKNLNISNDEFNKLMAILKKHEIFKFLLMN